MSQNFIIQLHKEEVKHQFSINKMQSSVGLFFVVFSILYGVIYGAHFRGGIISW